MTSTDECLLPLQLSQTLFVPYALRAPWPAPASTESLEPAPDLLPIGRLRPGDVSRKSFSWTILVRIAHRPERSERGR